MWERCECQIGKSAALTFVPIQGRGNKIPSGDDFSAGDEFTSLFDLDGDRLSQPEGQMRFGTQGYFLLAGQGRARRPCAGASARADSCALASARESADERTHDRTASDGNDIALLVGFSL